MPNMSIRKRYYRNALEYTKSDKKVNLNDERGRERDEVVEIYIKTSKIDQ